MKAEDFTKAVRPIVLANRGYSKIFGIGRNKTGTTTLEGIFKLYGLNVPNQQEQEIQITQQTYRGNYEPFRRFVDRYDCFQDQPFSQGNVYVAADALFPNSKFILTERDPEEWFESLCRYHRQIFGVENLKGITEEDLKTRFTYIYPGYKYENDKRQLTVFDKGYAEVRWDLIYDRDHYISRYVARNKAIKHYFLGRPQDLLVIDFSKEVTTERICRFLGIPVNLAVPVPHLNKSR